LTEEDEVARAARKSREWKARQAEMAEAAREDAQRLRRRRAEKEAERRETYHSNGIRNLVVMGAGAVVAFLIFERFTIAEAAGNCLEGARRPHQYNCAAQLTHSFWSWLIPSDMAEVLRANQL
jgi:hypothetical protein